MIPWRKTFSFCLLSVGIAALNPRLNFDDALAGNISMQRRERMAWERWR